MADLLRFSPRVTRSLQSLPRTQALLEIFDCRHDARIIRSYKKKQERNGRLSMKRNAALLIFIPSK